MSRHDRKKHRTNPCHAKGCDRRVPRPHLLCRRHWCALPGSVRKLVVRACREALPLGRSLATGGVVGRCGSRLLDVDDCRRLSPAEMVYFGMDLATGPSWGAAAKYTYDELGNCLCINVFVPTEALA